MLRTRRRGVVAAAAAIVAVIVVLALFFDRWFYESVALRLNTPSPADADFYHATLPVWDIIRYFPHLVGVAAAYGCILVRRRRWRPANVALVSVLVAALVANAAQDVTGRLRPNHAESAWAFTAPLAGLHERVPVGFPSGEVATAFALAAALRRVFRKVGAAFYVVAVGVGVARALFGMHYLSDVFAGAVVGLYVEAHARSMALRLLHRRRLRGHRHVPAHAVPR